MADGLEGIRRGVYGKLIFSGVQPNISIFSFFFFYMSERIAFLLGCVYNNLYKAHIFWIYH